MNLFYSHSKEDPLEELYKNLEKGSNIQLDKANLFSDLYTKLINFLHSEAIQFHQPAAEYLSPLKNINEIEVNFSKMELRVKDDFQDIFERQKIIRRLEEEQKECLKKLETIKLKVQTIKYSPNVDNNLTNSNQNTLKQSLLLEKSQILEQAKDLTRKLIIQKKKFLLFSKNRLQHAIQTLGEALVYVGVNESANFERIANKMSEFRPQIESLLCNSIYQDQISTENIKNPFEKV